MFVILPHRSVVCLRGPDRIKLLQGLLTQDVEVVSAEKCAYGAMLDNRGRFQHDFFIFADNEAIYLTPESARVEALLKTLRLYKLRSDVEITQLSDWRLGADLAAADPNATPGARLEWKIGWQFTDPRGPYFAAFMLGPAAAFTEPEDQETALALYADMRCQWALPEGCQDIPVGKGMALDHNLDLLRGISWDKGCYLGQELTARTKHVGQIRRRLFGLEVIEGTAESETPLTLDGRKAGVLRTVTPRYALARLYTSVAEEASSTGQYLETADGARFKVLPLPNAARQFITETG